MNLILPLVLLTTHWQDTADLDRDGLLDSWERDGFGPIDPKAHGCKPDRPDLFIVFKRRSGVTDEKFKPTVERIIRFYADLPYMNADGSTGVHVIPIIPDALDAKDDDKGYQSLYETGMPKEWRGLAHGVLVEVGTGGGGQTNRPDWCGSSNRWHTIVHELGHQLGLDHEPKDGRIGSPFFTSLMNYDYSYQFNDSGEAVHYSTGKFVGIRMQESDLWEWVPFPVKEMEFLTKRPYYFKIRPDGEDACEIDWNRNGIFGERHVRADVNDGYSTDFRANSTLDFAAGAPCLVSIGEDLALITPTLQEGKAYDKNIWRLGSDNPGEITVQIIKAGKIISTEVVATSAIFPVVGDASAIYRDGKLLLAYPDEVGVVLTELKREDDKFVSGKMRRYIAQQGEVTVVDTPNGVEVLHWNRESKSITFTEWEPKRTRVIPSLSSEQPVAAVWNDKLGALAVVEVINQEKKPGRMRISHLKYGASGWKVNDQVWVEGEKGNAATSSRPVILFDGSRDRGPNGGYNIYCKGRTDKPDAQAVGYVCRQIEDPTLGDGWRVRMMGNEWAFSMNSPTAVLHGGDIAYAYRLAFGDGKQKIFLSQKASGIDDRWLTDFDEVAYVFQHGLQDSLRRVQREVGLIK
ncbi:MAG: hypothetical protein KF836_05875 [Fimbriimonadaceae bacterium]|nr:hypothetical protein [Fimbriimonadaceae bacterium]